MLANSGSNNNLRGDKSGANRHSISANTSGLSKTQTFKSSKITGGFGLSSTANALAMIIGGQDSERQSAVTPERKTINTMIHARNLSSQAPSWILSKPKVTNGSIQPPSSISAR